ncbi:MAG: Maf family protein, partial [Candidatus Rokuibacteriota bacterium]
QETAAVTSRVRMAEYSDADIESYVTTGEPLDKAGAYAVQGLGGRLVAAVDGCLTNVIGLPLTTTRGLLERRGL